MYNFLLISGLITIGICLLIKYTDMGELFKRINTTPKTPIEPTKSIQIEDDADMEDNTPVTNSTFIEKMTYLDKKEDSRTDYRSNQHSWTNFFLFIIALYCIIQLIREFIVFMLVYETVENLNEALQLMWLH